ncbi:carbohydrate kinase family protein [Demequina salsinemoris]|uniref:carbohydrate kinase family protein n=1 Tax=Demequina salsinemoris TaxID=577470 RepID=UPI0007851561|nr:carbohydrate kinase [Demequina salsinemoris]
MSDHALVIGEALVDAVHSADGTITRHPGGSPANVALGLARLERDAELLTWLGDDADGALVRDHLRSSGVTLSPGSLDAEATSVATATLDASGAATYEFSLVWDLAANPMPRLSPTIVHTGSIAAVLEPGASAVLSTVESARDTATITYDPNARPSLMGDPAEARIAVERMVRLADVVKASDEDVAWLAPGEEIADVAEAWLALGAALVIVTRGSEGATAWSTEGEVDVRAPRVDVADTVGAGDSFMAGLIDGLWSEGVLGAKHRGALQSMDLDTVSAILERCVSIAAVTCSRPGANPPTRDELDG